jgi:hypothetical protein
MTESAMGESPAYTLTTLRALFIGSRDALTLRPSLHVHLVPPGGDTALSGRVVSFTSKLTVQTEPDKALIEDVQPEWITHAEVR